LFSLAARRLGGPWREIIKSAPFSLTTVVICMLIIGKLRERSLQRSLCAKLFPKCVRNKARHLISKHLLRKKEVHAGA